MKNNPTIEERNIPIFFCPLLAGIEYNAYTNQIQKAEGIRTNKIKIIVKKMLSIYSFCLNRLSCEIITNVLVLQRGFYL